MNLKLRRDYGECPIMTMLLPFRGRYCDIVRISPIPTVNLGMVSTLAIFNSITELLSSYKVVIYHVRKNLPSKNQLSIILFAS